MSATQGHHAKHRQTQPPNQVKKAIGHPKSRPESRQTLNKKTPVTAQVPSHNARPKSSNDAADYAAAKVRIGQMMSDVGRPREKASGAERIVRVSPNEVKKVGQNIKQGPIDLHKIDGHATTHVDDEGTVVERKFTVLWDQRRTIDKSKLTPEHELVKVTESEFEIRQEKLVVKEQVVERQQVVPEIRKVEIDLRPKK